MAKKTETAADLEIQRIKDPEYPGDITFRGRILRDGEVVASLGALTIEEDEIAAKGHDAIDARVREHFAKVRQVKGV